MAYSGEQWYFQEIRGGGGVAGGAPPKLTPWQGSPDCPAPPEAVSFSQFGEDMALYNHFFCNQSGGTYVEIGANNGLTYSNTLFFDTFLRWGGALIEASAASARELRRLRPSPRNAIFEEGVCPEGQTTMAFTVSNETLVGGDPTAMSHVHTKTFERHFQEVVQVPCRPLGKILREMLEQRRADHIDFFSLDVEGGELAVLSTMDWAVPVRLWIVELDGTNQSKDDAVRELLAVHGYARLNATGFRAPNEVFERVAA